MSNEAKIEAAKRNEHPLVRWDLEIARVFQGYAATRSVKVLGTASEIADQPPLIALSALIAGVGHWRGDSILRRTGLRMLASHLTSTGLKNIVKGRVDRPRPHDVAEEGRHRIDAGDASDDDERSFPSGHSAGAVAVVRAVAREHPAWGPPLYAAAGVASLAQLPRQKHYPTDVLLGAAIGLVAEGMVSAAMSALEPDRRS